MRFGIKKKYVQGKYIGCVKEKERRELKGQLDRGEKSKEEYLAHLADILQDEDPANDRSIPKVVLDLLLEHGSFCFMVGPDFQKYLEHEITVHSPFRFAFTFRPIADGKTGATEGQQNHENDGNKKDKGVVESDEPDGIKVVGEVKDSIETGEGKALNKNNDGNRETSTPKAQAEDKTMERKRKRQASDVGSLDSERLDEKQPRKVPEADEQPLRQTPVNFRGAGRGRSGRGRGRGSGQGMGYTQ